MNLPEVRWLEEPNESDYRTAHDYLDLLVDEDISDQATGLLREAEPTIKKAKDILRASVLPVLPIGDPRIAKDVEHVSSGVALSPVLLARGDNLIIADGYSRVCLCFHLDPDFEIPCRLI